MTIFLPSLSDIEQPVCILSLRALEDHAAFIDGMAAYIATQENINTKALPDIIHAPVFKFQSFDINEKLLNAKSFFSQNLDAKKIIIFTSKNGFLASIKTIQKNFTPEEIFQFHFYLLSSTMENLLRTHFGQNLKIIISKNGAEIAQKLNDDPTEKSILYFSAVHQAVDLEKLIHSKNFHQIIAYEMQDLTSAIIEIPDGHYVVPIFSQRMMALAEKSLPNFENARFSALCYSNAIAATSSSNFWYQIHVLKSPNISEMYKALLL